MVARANAGGVSGGSSGERAAGGGAVTLWESVLRFLGSLRRTEELRREPGER